jgi:hypothetical protein
MDAKQAADTIREHVNFDHSTVGVSADDQHHHRWVLNVLHHLGMEPNVFNFAHVAETLSAHGLHHGIAEYPKMLVNEEGKPVLKDGKHIVFADAAEEEEHHHPLAAIEHEERKVPLLEHEHDEHHEEVH